MRKIFKYTLIGEHLDGVGASWVPEQTLALPCYAKILSVGYQHGKMVMWALVNPDPAIPKESRTIFMRGTGYELSDEFDGRRFIGTIICGSGGIILHVFE